MSTIMVKGQEVRVGDDLWSMGTPHRVTRIKPYVHPVVTRGEKWRVAYSDGPGGVKAWGRTLSYDHGYAAGYEVTALPGDSRREPHVPADDYLSPFYGEGAVLWEKYAAEGSPGLWRDWLKANAPAGGRVFYRATDGDADTGCQRHHRATRCFGRWANCMPYPEVLP